MSCSYNISIVPKVIHMFDLYLKKKQPPLPLERSVSQEQGGPNEVRSSSPVEERVHIGQKREVLHVAFCGKFFEWETSSAKAGNCKREEEKKCGEGARPPHTARTSTCAPLPQNAFRS